MKGNANIISWKTHGRAFAIHCTKAFADRVVPLWFNQTSIRSFFRQLSLYGFKQITQGRDKGVYYHELFLRGKPFLARRIVRQKVKGTKIRGLRSPETEPNFYAMPYVNASKLSPKESLSFPSKQNEDLASFIDYNSHSNSVGNSSCTSVQGICSEPSKNREEFQYKAQRSMKSQSSQGREHGNGQHEKHLNHNEFVQKRKQNDFSTAWTSSENTNHDNITANYFIKDDKEMFNLLQDRIESDHVSESSIGPLRFDPFHQDDISIDDHVAQTFSLFECQVLCSLFEGMEQETMI